MPNSNKKKGGEREPGFPVGTAPVLSTFDVVFHSFSMACLFFVDNILYSGKIISTYILVFITCQTIYKAVVARVSCFNSVTVIENKYINILIIVVQLFL